MEDYRNSQGDIEYGRFPAWSRLPYMDAFSHGNPPATGTYTGKIARNQFERYVYGDDPSDYAPAEEEYPPRMYARLMYMTHLDALVKGPLTADTPIGRLYFSTEGYRFDTTEKE